MAYTQAQMGRHTPTNIISSIAFYRWMLKEQSTFYDKDFMLSSLLLISCLFFNILKCQIPCGSHWMVQIMFFLFLFIFNLHVFVNFPKSHLLLFSTFGYSSITIHAWFLESYILKTLVIDWMFDVSLKTCVNWESGCVALLLWSVCQVDVIEGVA